MNRAKAIWIPIILLGWAMTVVAAPAWNGSIEENDGWSTVNNPRSPIGEREVIETDLLWRIGGEEEDVLFGLIEDAVVDEEGNAYLLDTVLSTIHVVSPTGEVERTLSREGDGPGEFRFARELRFLPDGALGIMEMMPGRIVSVDRQGTPRPSFALGDQGQGVMNHLSHIAANGTNVLIGQIVTNFGNGVSTTVHSLASYDAGGNQLAVIREHRDEQRGDNISLDFGGGENDFTRRFSLCPDGRVVLFPEAGGYRMEILDIQGVRRKIIRRDYESVRRSKQDLDDQRKQAEAMRERFQGDVEMRIEEWARDISDVIVRPDGALWVVNSQGDRDRTDGTIGWFDVFDHDGRYTHRLALRADYDPDRDNYVVTGNSLFVFKEAQKAPPRTSTMGGAGGGMMVMMVSGGTPDEEEDEEEEALPYEVICYRLPD